MAFKLTSHTLVKNEEVWIKPALESVINFIDTLLVWDTASTDKTVSLIKSIKSPKIKFRQSGPVDREGLVNLRNEQIKATKTDWFLLLDGDEIWPEENLRQLIQTMAKAQPETLALVNRTRNCLGDLNHYLPETKGRYHIGPWSGHLNIRAIRNLPGLTVVGSYPNEAYVYQGKKLQDQPERLEFCDTWYYHTTHLKRTGFWHSLRVVDRLKKYKLSTFKVCP
ncbi:MAG: glycosyltransferase [Candidatus Beckwithbacteria bacterium]|nr:glycosyltransferase [Candidatus Beckwithbacteria bacterium]